MRVLSIDIETYSGTNLRDSGVYKYVEDPAFEILLFAYAYNDEPVQVLDLASADKLPQDVLKALQDFNVLKTAFNANFEITCISKFFGITLFPDQWECTMVRSAVAGLPLSLKAVGQVLNLDQQKMAIGKALVTYFCVPCKPTRSNGQRLRNLPQHDADKWELFKEYCCQDVVTERAIRNKLSFIEITDKERDLWALDQQINARGILLDQQLVENAINIDADYKDELTLEASDLTGLTNPNSVAQLKTWLAEQMQEGEIKSLNKQAIKDLLESTECPDVTRLLQLRREMSKTSIRKYETMRKATCTDGRVHGLLQFYGANRTGRWAGRLVQVQNLPKNHLKDLDLARNLVKANDAETLRLCFGNVPNVLSELIRTSFVAKEGHTFVVADFSAIEARVIAWLADEYWVTNVFKTHGKIYEATAANMFHVPIEEVTKGSPMRDRGKVAVLALGYQGGVNALTVMDTAKSIPEDEKQGIVNMWRNANKAIVRLWYEVDKAALRAVREATTVTIRHGVTFIGGSGMLFIKLPSGRKLSYVRPRLVPGKFGGDSLQYEGMDQTKKTWGKVDTYGGKLTENIVQAIARDLLAEAMLSLYLAHYRIVMHIHDEVVLEVPENLNELDSICRIMGQEVSWAKGLPLRADGYVTKYYLKE